jgi:hypothetical protein
VQSVCSTNANFKVNVNENVNVNVNWDGIHSKVYFINLKQEKVDFEHYVVPVTCLMYILCPRKS